MSYYQSLGLEKEPFSTSPDPAFLFRSAGHSAVLNRLEIAIRLRRGLGLILGDVGIGKTTILRALIQEFSQEQDFIFHMILDPDYNSEFQLLESLAKRFKIVPNSRTTHDYREEIEKYLFKQGVEENKTIVLLIDEGQKLAANHLEVLRTLLNYETNEYKLLQLAIMGQMELLPKVKKIKNFYDRVALRYIINPLDEAETGQMIDFRLKTAGLASGRSLFSPESIRLIFRYTEGYPRKIALVCHNALEELIIRNKQIVDETLVSQVIKREDI